MPVYESGDYEIVIKRIQEKTDALRLEMGGCLSEETIMAFEERHKIKLPQSYRLFLKYIGNAVRICLKAVG